MTRCETHDLEHEDGEECPTCHRERRRAEAVKALMGFDEPAAEWEPPVTAPSAPLVRALAESQAAPEVEVELEPELAPESMIDPEPVPAPTQAASSEETARIEDEIRRLESDLGAPVVTPTFEAAKPAVAEAPAAATSDAEALERFNATAAQAGPTGAAPRASDPEMSAARIQELIDKKANVVGLLGFPGAGKTWFLNRLKYELFTSRNDRHEAIPPHAAQWDSVGRTNGVSEHYFRSDAYGAPSSFYVIDIPGERFISLAEGRFLGRERELLALKACNALIIVVPADEVLLGERASALYSRPGSASKGTELEQKAQAMAVENVRLERFTANVAQLNVVLSLLEQKVEVAKIAAMTAEDLIRHLDSPAYQPSSKPVFVALSKADVIEAQAVASFKAQEEGADQPGSLIDLLYRGSPADIEALQEFDRDPEEIVDRYRPALASAINAFRWSKFDFVTAFRGHGDGDIGGTVVDYNLGRRGVAAVLRWMEWARASDTGLTKADWRAIAAARGLRRFKNEGRFHRPKKADQFR
ncbi:MAG: hypothetical protein JWR59_2235 [Brevundimonas sp.]|nr:hypothetical protein [Brevundimonas sp.]